MVDFFIRYFFCKINNSIFMMFLLFIYFYKIVCVKVFVKMWNVVCGGGGDISIFFIFVGRIFLI